MKFNIVLPFLEATLFVVLGIAFGLSVETTLDAKQKEWFASAKPISQVPYVIDAKGCLYGLVDGPGGPTLIATLGNDKKPMCKAQ